jgi:hypothetical protein
VRRQAGNVNEGGGDVNVCAQRGQTGASHDAGPTCKERDVHVGLVRMLLRAANPPFSKLVTMTANSTTNRSGAIELRLI